MEKLPLWISIGAIVGWTIFYIPKAIIEIVAFKDHKKAKLSMLLWLICVGIQGICLSISLLVEKLG